MTQHDKLVARLLAVPRDFTYDEARKVLNHYGFKESNKGKTSGSRVEFVRENDTILLHKPHPSGQLKVYAVRQLIETLKDLKYL